MAGSEVTFSGLVSLPNLLRIRLPWKIHTQLGLMAKLEDLNQSEMLEVLVEEGFARRSEMVQEFFSIGGKG